MQSLLITIVALRAAQVECKNKPNMINRAARHKNTTGFSGSRFRGLQKMLCFCHLLSLMLENSQLCISVGTLRPSAAQLQRNGNESSISSSWSVLAKISILNVMVVVRSLAKQPHSRFTATLAPWLVNKNRLDLSFFFLFIKCKNNSLHASIIKAKH